MICEIGEVPADTPDNAQSNATAETFILSSNCLISNFNAQLLGDGKQPTANRQQLTANRQQPTANRRTMIHFDWGIFSTRQLHGICLNMLLLILIGIILGGVVYYLFQSDAKLPPLAPSDMFTNANMMATCEGLTHMNHIRKLCRWCFTMGYGTERGSVFRMSLPQFCPTIVVSDYKLARVILAGDSKTNLREAEKSIRMKALNLIDNVDNIIR